MKLSDIVGYTRGAATCLVRSGAQRGRPVMAMTRSPAALSVLSGAAAAIGAPLFPLDPASPDAVVEELIGQTGTRLVIGERPVSGCSFVPDAALFETPSASAPPPSCLRPGDIALLMATSGTTGRPKAVMLTAGALEAAARASAARTPLGPGDIWLACLPLFHIGGHSILIRCAVAGAEAVIQQGFDAGRLARALVDSSVTHVSLVPAMLAHLLEALPRPPLALRHVLVGGAALPPALAERAADQGWPIQPTYGMSETASQLATLARLPRPWRQGLVGRPLPGADAGLTADGRLRVRGPMLMAGYANPALSPGDGLEEGWFVTNDLAEITAEGDLVILGRADDVINSGGKKILPAIVEPLLGRCPGLETVAIVGRPDAVWGEIVTAVYRGEIPPQALLDWCRDHVSGALRPRLAVRIDRFPLLASGKPDRAALRRIAAGNQTESGAVRHDQGPAGR